MKTETKLGIFFLVVFAILLYFIVKLGSISIVFEKPGYHIKACFQSIAGLEKRAPVRIAGVKVGYVEDIRLVEGRAEVIMKIYQGYRINRGSKAAVTSMGMMGEKYIEIFPGDPANGAVSEGEEIEGIPPLSIDQLGTIFYSIAQDIKSLSASLKEVLGTEVARTNLKEILESINNITNQMNLIIEENRLLVADSLQETRRAAKDLRLLIEGLKENSHQLSALMKKLEASSLPEAEKLMKELSVSSKQLRQVLGEAEQVLERINAGEGTVGRLLQDRTAYQRLEGVLKEAEELTGRLKGMLPSRSSLSPAFEAYYEGGLRASLGLQLEQEGSFLRAGVVERQEKLTYTLTAGRHLGNFSLAAGIIEGSFGFDLSGDLNRKLYLRGEFFNFRQGSFKYRFSLGLRLMEGFSLVGGYGRDGFFVGISYVK